MADYYSSNAYSRSNASSNNGGGSGSGNNNGYYSNTTNNNSSNDFYSSANNPYAQPTQQSSNNQQQQYQPQQQQQQQQQTQPSLFSSFTTPNQPDSNNTSTNSMPSLWNPTMATQLASAAIASSSGANGNNNEAIYKMGLQFGSTFLDQGTARLIPGLETFMRTLRVYFAVDNGYVKRKMMRVLCSFFCKSWSRLPNNSSVTTPHHHQYQQQQQQQTSLSPYALPIHDDNAPDLYIPFMSLITYVLLCALCYGTAGQFDPEVIVNVTTKCMMIQLLECCLFKLGVYLMNGGGANESNGVAFLDLLAFTGYKYLALTCNMLIGLGVTLMKIGSGTSSSTESASMEDGELEESVNAASKIAAAAAAAAANNTTNEGGYGGQRGYYIMFLWTASSISYFMLKTMANNVPHKYQQQNSAGGGPKREFVILGFALSQFVTLWFLGQTKFLN